jgi:lipooligosaccharide transport system permease protein
MKNDAGFRISRRFIRVWKRDLMVYRKNWKVSFIVPLLEPLFYLLAFGVGLGALVGNVRYHGQAISYVLFIAPALIAVSVMQNAFFETTYASYVRMYYQKTFDAMMATPLSVDEVITGEIIWGATKSLIAATIMMTVISAFGLIRYPEGLLVLPLAFIGGIAFGSVGMFFTAWVKNIEMFNLPILLFVTPMFLFSGTFFPLDTLPSWAQDLAQFLPLTHLVDLTRSLAFGEAGRALLWALGYLLMFSLVFFPLAVYKMRRRLIT